MEQDLPKNWFTQPQLYKHISAHPNVYKIFLEELVKAGDIAQEEAQKLEQGFKEKLQEKLQIAKQDQVAVKADYLKKHWKNIKIC